MFWYSWNITEKKKITNPYISCQVHYYSKIWVRKIFINKSLMPAKAVFIYIKYSKSNNIVNIIIF